MEHILRKLKSFAEHPLTQLITGLVLLVTGVAQAVDDVFHAERHFRLGVHHGVALLGLVQVLSSLPSIVEGLDLYFRSRELSKRSLSKDHANQEKQ